MKEYIVAIELGSSKIVGIAGYRNESKELVVTAIEKEDVTNIIKRGCVQNIEGVYFHINKIKQMLENRIAPAKIVKTYVGMSGVSVTAESHVARRTFHEDSIIKQEHVRKMSDDCRRMVSENKYVITAVSAGCVIDGRPERTLIGATGTTVEANYKVITAKPVLKSNIDRCIVERAKLPIVEYVATALTTADVVLSNEDRTLGCMLIDCGAETTTVSIYKNDNLISLNTLPMGGANITRDIMSLNVVNNEAERLKHYSMAKGFNKNNNILFTFEGENTPEIDPAKLASVVEARSEEIVANIGEQLKLAGLKEGEILAAGIVVVGGAAKLNNWNELLEERLGMKVRVGVLRKDIHVEEKEASQVNEYVQAVGLLNHAKEVCTVTYTTVDTPDTDVPVNNNSQNGNNTPQEENKSQTGKNKEKKKENIIRRFLNTVNGFIEAGEPESGENDD